jgi:hypothetical protein
MTAALNIELRSIKHSKSLSEETPAYTAALFLDGRKVAEISNHGHGGADMVRWTAPAAEARIRDHFASLPPIKAYGMELPQDLELWCHETVNDQDIVKTIRRSRNVSGITTDGKELGWKVKIADLPRFRNSITSKHPGIRFFHEMTDAEILAIARGAR